MNKSKSTQKDRIHRNSCNAAGIPPEFQDSLDSGRNQ